MEMFLMAFCLSMLGVAVSAALFGAATVDERRKEAAAARTLVAAERQPQFFAASAALGVPAGTPVRAAVPDEILLLLLEQHVRVEQAAAEAFYHFPNADSLHARTISPLVH